MKKTVLFLITLFVLMSVSAQQSLNDYKYIIIPKKFEFLKEADQYRINSLTKFLFEKYNFETLFEDETFPSDYAQNNCLGLKANVLKDSNLFKTKLSVQLKNCKNEVIFTSAQGESRDKSFKIAFNQALRSAFLSFKEVEYSYNSKNEIIANNADEKLKEGQKEIAELKEEIQILKENKSEIVPEGKTEIKSINEFEEPKVTSKQDVINTSRLRAEAIENSAFAYNLINSNGDIIYSILFSGKTDLYIVKDKDAIIYKLNKKWVIAEANGNDLKVTALEINF